MAKITEIKKQVKNSDRVSVFVDGKYSFSLGSMQWAQSGLKIDQELDQKQIESYKSESSFGKLLDQALNWALRRNHSELEISKYLDRKTQDPKTKEKLLARLDSADFIDDHRFTQSWVESRRRRGYSDYIIKGELFKKGVAEQVINDVLATVGNQTSALKILIEKKSKQTRYKDPKKLLAYLASKGFSYEDIKNELDKLKED